MIQRLRLPAIFWRDHFDRCSDHPGTRTVVRDTGRIVVVDLDQEAIDDLLSDAEYYASGVDFAGEREAYRSLINSARATVRLFARLATP